MFAILHFLENLRKDSIGYSVIQQKAGKTNTTKPRSTFSQSDAIMTQNPVVNVLKPLFLLRPHSQNTLAYWVHS